MKTKIFFALLFVVSVLTGCSDNDSLLPSEEELFPTKTNTELDKQLNELFRPYNTIVEYRYIKNLIPDDWYYIYPVEEELVVPMAEFLKAYWIGPLEAGSSREFVVKNFPRMILLIGSSAYNMDGTRVTGQAEGGTLIRFTEVNDYNIEKEKWISGQLETAFHEYAHILHQTFGFPDDYRDITPDSYTKGGWKSLKLKDDIKLGMVSNYACSAPEEDFAELFYFWIVSPYADLEYVFNEQPTGGLKPSQVQDVVEMNAGRRIIQKKLLTMEKYLQRIGVDLQNIRNDLQHRLGHEE